MDWSSNGFRIRVELPSSDLKDNKKFFIFIDLKWTKIKNIQDHVKSIFNIDEEVTIFVDDVLLPENETIKVIQPEDTLVIRIQHKKKEKGDPVISKWDEMVEDSISLDSNKKSKFKRKKNGGNIKEDTDEQLISACLEELRTKREQFTKGNHFDMNAGSSPTDSPVTESLFSHPTLKKRKRKHKKKNKDECVEECISNKSHLLQSASLEPISKHIQFFDEGDDLCASSMTEMVKENDVEKGNTKLSSLLLLVNKPTSEKVFTRKNDVLENTVLETKLINPITSITNTSHEKITNSEGKLVHSAVTVPKVGDLISFKKMKLGSNYTPQISNEIVGEVLNVEDSRGSLLVVFNIKVGADEFEEPSGKFSLEIVEKESYADVNHVVKIHWSDVWEPRIINST